MNRTIRDLLLLRPCGGTWTPTRLVGLELWLPANQLTGLADDDEMTTFTDQSGHGRDFTQADGGKKPTYKVNIAGGKPGVLFNGTSDVLVNASNFCSSQQGIVWFVFQLSASPSNYQRILTSSKDDGSAYYWLATAYRHSTTKNLSLYTYDAAGADINRGSTDLSSATTYAAIIQSDGATITMRLDGAAEPTVVVAGGNNGDWLGDNPNRTLFALGAYKNSGETQYFKGYLLELGLCSQVPSSGDIAKLESYLEATYSLDF